MKDRVDGTNMPKITTYRTFDSVPSIPPRGPSQRAMPLPVAEVPPTPKSNSYEKLYADLPPQANHTGLRKIESLRMPVTSTEFNHIRYKRSFSRGLEYFNLKILPELFLVHHHNGKLIEYKNHRRI